MGNYLEFTTELILTTPVIKIYKERINSFVDKLDSEYQVILDELLNEYHKLGNLQRYSFDLDFNVQLRLIFSANLANSLGVPGKDILKNEKEIDKYFLY